jgi:hypothetical protein
MIYIHTRTHIYDTYVYVRIYMIHQGAREMAADQEPTPDMLEVEILKRLLIEILHRQDTRALTFENFILRIAYTFDITHGTYILYCILPIQFSQQEVHRIAWVFRRFRDFAKDAMLDNPRQLAEHIIRWKSSQINLLLRGLNELTIALTWMNFCQRV